MVRSISLDYSIGVSDMVKKNTMNLFEIYDYINKLERRIKRVEAQLKYKRKKKKK